ACNAPSVYGCQPADAVALMSCLQAPPNGVNVKLMVRHALYGTTSPSLYVGLLDLENGEIVHRWTPLPAGGSTEMVYNYNPPPGWSDTGTSVTLLLQTGHRYYMQVTLAASSDESTPPAPSP